MERLAITLLLCLSAGVLDAQTNSAESALLASFPQLLWSRAKLEFNFELRAGIQSAIEAGSSSEAEAFKWAKRMESTFSDRKEREFFMNGWKMTGRVHSNSVTFSTRAYKPWGVDSEVELLFDRQKLIALNIYAVADAGCTKLYQVLTKSCGAPSKRSVTSATEYQFKWMISGTNHYEAILDSRRFKSEVERGLTVFVKHSKI